MAFNEGVSIEKTDRMGSPSEYLDLEERIAVKGDGESQERQPDAGTIKAVGAIGVDGSFAA